jgi:hypothetical protein
MLVNAGNIFESDGGDGGASIIFPGSTRSQAHACSTSAVAKCDHLEALESEHYFFQYQDGIEGLPISWTEPQAQSQ